MKASLASLWSNIPENLPDELCQTLLEKPTVRIERIVSRGHASPEGFWYQQDKDEWVLLVKGSAGLAFADGEVLTMRAGDYLLIPAHCRHRVTWTQPDSDCVWLAIFI